jgi:hypothetical protein
MDVNIGLLALQIAVATGQYNKEAKYKSFESV